MRSAYCVYILAAALLLPCSAFATFNQTTQWKGDHTTLSFYDNYGTPLGEQLRHDRQAMKAYHLFVLLERAGLDIHVLAMLHPGRTEDFGADVVLEELRIDELEEALDIELATPEQFNPVWVGDEMVHQEWREGELHLKADGAALYSSSEPFVYHGSRETHIVLTRGNAYTLTEGALTPISALTGDEPADRYEVEDLIWIDGTSVLALGDDVRLGWPRLVKVNVVEGDSPCLELEDPGFRRVAARSEPFTIVGLKTDVVRDDDGVRQVHAIMEYDADTGEWTTLDETEDEIFLAGVTQGGTAWWNADESALVFSDGTIMEDVEARLLSLYPKGRYSYGGGASLDSEAEARRKLVLLYQEEHEAELRARGLTPMSRLPAAP